MHFPFWSHFPAGTLHRLFVPVEDLPHIWGAGVGHVHVHVVVPREEVSVPTQFGPSLVWQFVVHDAGARVVAVGAEVAHVGYFKDEIAQALQSVPP